MVDDNETIKQQIAAATQEVRRLCRGDRSWRMSIPAREDDSDVVLSTALDAARRMLDERNAARDTITALAADLAIAQRERDQLLTALADMVVKATAYGSQDGGFVATYILPTGSIHRAIPLLDELGVVVRPGFDGRCQTNYQPLPITTSDSKAK